MRNRRFVKAAAVVCGLSLLAAACGSDDDSSLATTPTTPRPPRRRRRRRAASAPRAPPRPRRPPTRSRRSRTEMQAFADDAGIDLADTYAYGPESYDSTIIIALAAQVAGTDGSAAAAEIVDVTKGGEKCSTYADCLDPDRGRHRHRLRGHLRPHRHVGQRRAARRLLRRAGLRRRQPPRPRAGDLQDGRRQRGVREHAHRPGRGRAGRRRRAQDRHPAAGDGQPRLPRTTRDRGRADGHRRDQRGRWLQRQGRRARPRATPATPPPTPPSRRSPASCRRTSTPSSAPPAPACRPASSTRSSAPV